MLCEFYHNKAAGLQGNGIGTEEIAQWLRALASLLEDSNSVHIVTHSVLSLRLLEILGLPRDVLHTCGGQTCM